MADSPKQGLLHALVQADNEEVPPMNATPIRVVLYSHDAQGLGHLRRNLALSHHLARLLPQAASREVTGLVVTGLAPGEGMEAPEGFDWLVLPGVIKSHGEYRPRRLHASRSSLGLLRSNLLQAALVSFAPDLLIIDRHPYGVRHELRQPLRRLKSAHPGTRVVLGLREVLDTPHALVKEWASLGSQRQLGELIDEAWVYGDPEVHNLVDTGEAPEVLRDRVRFTGYLAHGRREVECTAAADAQGPAPTGPFVLTTAGGGSDALPLLMEAAGMEPPPGHQHVVVCGPQLGENEFRRVSAQGGPRTLVRRTWPGMSRHIDRASAVISMGGYNTVCEILSTSTPALVVPRERPRQEQLIRASALRRRGAVELLRSQDMDASALGRWTASAVDRRTSRAHIDLDGLRTVPTLAHELLSGSHALVGVGA